MSTAGGAGAASDPSVEIRERLTAVPSDPHAADRAALQLELYQIQHRVPGTPEHAAHRAQLLRQARDADRAFDAAVTAEERAAQALEGAREARRVARDEVAHAIEAVDAFDRDYGTPDDGSAE